MSIVGIIAAVMLARKAHHPSRAWVVTAVAGTLLSLVFPLTTTADTATATQVVLVLSHFLAAAVIIPPVVRRLAAVQPSAGGFVAPAVS